jgi:mRNA-degrading endonuclease RelE of RelBE toxin-antitoxin system
MYDLFLEPEVHAARQELPGNVRQRVRRTIEALADDPRPHDSRTLNLADLDLPPGVEIRRVRLEHWRIVYALNDSEQWVWVLGLYRRPPYDYADLPDLARKLADQ